MYSTCTMLYRFVECEHSQWLWLLEYITQHSSFTGGIVFSAGVFWVAHLNKSWCRTNTLHNQVWEWNDIVCGSFSWYRKFLSLQIHAFILHVPVQCCAGLSGVSMLEYEYHIPQYTALLHWWGCLSACVFRVAHLNKSWCRTNTSCNQVWEWKTLCLAVYGSSADQVARPTQPLGVRDNQSD